MGVLTRVSPLPKSLRLGLISNPSMNCLRQALWPALETLCGNNIVCLKGRQRGRYQQVRGRWFSLGPASDGGASLRALTQGHGLQRRSAPCEQSSSQELLPASVLRRRSNSRTAAGASWRRCATSQSAANSIVNCSRRALAIGSGSTRLDVTDSQSIDALVAGLDLPNRPLDAVVHNAGIGAGGAFEDLDDTLFRRVMETNFFGVLALTRRLLPAFRAQRHGRIVIISSETAFAGQPAISPYCASKWAAEGWAESLAYELEPFNIQISLIEPGARARTSGRARRGSFRRKAFTGR